MHIICDGGSCVCGVYVAYRRLSDWTRLQWALYS